MKLKVPSAALRGMSCHGEMSLPSFCNITYTQCEAQSGRDQSTPPREEKEASRCTHVLYARTTFSRKSGAESC